MGGAGGRRAGTGNRKSVSKLQGLTKRSEALMNYQRVVVVHLDDGARRLLLDVLQVSAQQQAAHQQALVPCWAESLTDHLKATRKHTYILERSTVWT